MVENTTQKVNKIIKENWGQSQINNKETRTFVIKMLILNPLFFEEVNF